MDGKDTGSGGGRPEDILFVFVGGRPGNVAFRFGDVGPELPYKAVPGKLPESVAQWITGRYPMRRGGGGGEYLSLEAEREGTSFEDIGVYTKRRQNMVAQYIATRPIMDLCERSI